MYKPKKPQLKILYDNIIAAGNQFKDYNFRHYVLRKTNQDFAKFEQQDNKEEDIEKFIANQENHLQIIQRQTVIQNLYFKSGIIIENKE